VSSAVLDASALLALVLNEPGRSVVAAAVGAGAGAVIGTVNLSEVVAKLRENGATEAAIHLALDPLAITVANFDTDLAYAAGFLRPATRAVGLSMSDRACLALAQRLSLPVLTADRAWASLSLGITITVIR